MGWAAINAKHQSLPSKKQNNSVIPGDTRHHIVSEHPSRGVSKIACWSTKFSMYPEVRRMALPVKRRSLQA